ncbi:SRPBCC family protein [Thalassobacillus pellis]|uniref:SRPBCC family protein n=1 Tax=Thalassobacillus pellis TaxID=748008 RepID=UPI00195F5510|nr:SRPBCC family protein [Thalassobacillus pellis]MBM7553013.1 uncharacterized protein YndB with AHSA1/START domain [Thalassobacillus pellis]
MTTLNQSPIVQTDMLIRRPVGEVFEAFINPEITSKFWFTRSSGQLEAGKTVEWEWEMYSVSATVEVKEVEKNKRILLEWGEADNRTTVEWVFTSRGDKETFVSIINKGFKGDEESLVDQAIDAMGGFTMVLCALKALLEHGVMLNVVEDKAPDSNVKDWQGR